MSIPNGCFLCHKPKILLSCVHLSKSEQHKKLKTQPRQMLQSYKKNNASHFPLKRQGTLTEGKG
jgi:hypothetical protein